MSLETKKTSEINALILGQIEASLNQSIPLLPKSFLRVLAKVLAGVWILLYKYCGFIWLQMFVATASNKETIINGRPIIPLTEWGILIGTGKPGLASNAQLTIDITVTSQTGYIDSYSQLINSTNGVTYITIGVTELDADTVRATIKAVSDEAGTGGAGIIGNLNAGDIVSFANPLPNIDRDAVVVEQVVTGADPESDEAYRERVLDRFQKLPQGGALADYEQWGEEPTGIINVYPYTSSNPGQVELYVEATPESSGNEDGFPTDAQLESVLESVFYNENGTATRKPVGSLPNAFSITRVAFDVEIVGLNVSNEPTVRESIEEAVKEYFLGKEPFIDGLSIPPREDRVVRAVMSSIVDAIVSSNNGTFLIAYMKIDDSAQEVYTLGMGEKAKLNSITFTS